MSFESRVEQVGRHRWRCQIYATTIGAPYISILVTAWTKDRALKKARGQFDREMFSYERQKATREVRSVP